MISEEIKREMIKHLRRGPKRISTTVFEHIIDMRDDLIDLNEEDLVSDEQIVILLLQEIVQTALEELIKNKKRNAEEEE